MNAILAVTIGVFAVGLGNQTSDSQISSPSSTVKVMSYNIHHGAGMDKKVDIVRIAEVIRKANADIVGLQEVDVKTERAKNFDIPAVIGEHLKMNHAFVKAIPVGKGEYGNAVVSRQSMKVVETFPLSLPKGAEARAALIVKVEQPTPYYFIVTHFPWEEKYEDARVKIVQEMTKIVKSKNYTPAIFVGDFNAEPAQPCIEELRKNWDVTNDVSLGKTYDSIKPSVTIDYICTYPKNAFKIIKHEVVNDNIASDHRPIMTELQFNSK